MDMHERIFLAGALALTLTGAAGAQQFGDDEQGVTELDLITVTTPLRRESSLERSTSSVTVIEEEEIARSPAVDLPSLLKTFPGVNVTSYGGMGAAASVGLRGTTAAQTLVLVDGVNMRSATLGTTALFNIPLDAIERIEIAKGAHSAQYGADAIGGVINIITKTGSAGCPEGKSICTTLTAGVIHPWGGHAGINTRGTLADGTRFAIGGSIIGTQGYNFTTPANLDFEPDDDGFLLGSFNASISRDFDWGEAYTTAFYSRSRGEYDAAPSLWDPAPANEADYTNFAAKIGARIDHAHDWHSRVEVSLGYDDQENFRSGTPTLDRYQTLRYGIFGSTTKEFDTGALAHALTVGVEAYQEETKSTFAYIESSRNVGAAFAQHTVRIGELTIDGGIRYDHNELYEDATTYNIGASYEFVPGLVGRASYATGFRVPTFNELYGPFGGNPGLKPERSEGYEVGLSWRPTDATSLDLAFYQTTVDDQINWEPMDPSDPFSPWWPNNIDRVDITGFEASLDHRFDHRWRTRLGVDIRDVRDQDGVRVASQERLKLLAEVGFQPTEKLDLLARVSYVEPGNTDILPAYTLVDIAASYDFDPQTTLKVSVDNLFDKRYSTNFGYRAPGRTVKASLSKTF